MTGQGSGTSEFRNWAAIVLIHGQRFYPPNFEIPKCLTPADTNLPGNHEVILATSLFLGIDSSSEDGQVENLPHESFKFLALSEFRR